jgi:hypothetical protein
MEIKDRSGIKSECCHNLCDFLNTRGEPYKIIGGILQNIRKIEFSNYLDLQVYSKEDNWISKKIKITCKDWLISKIQTKSQPTAHLSKAKRPELCMVNFNGLSIQCVNEALCLISGSMMADSFTYPNPTLRQAPIQYA